ncbi:probable LRR receptor-like serine/threonine-protein kinase At3g47570 [Sesamum indicum]|uniref:non-specific serine/threonine protein kinase n=1 Tax=Sesamum indicum TaxID=4182 RepID=A0A6I9UD64_SESIN|nr:probable LRR receptor-like serine/threonine-protein kinase At3g47570 [Sesamum indicum]
MHDPSKKPSTILVQFVPKTMIKLSMINPCMILLFFFYFATTPATCSNNETDLQALLAFKRSIDDDPTGVLNSWNETLHFCSWKGILCSKRHQNRVVSINLMSQGLVGTLSPHLGNLSFLRTIILQNNSFHGFIPEEIGRLRRLELIEFSNNSFGGEIPRNLSNCRNLYYLNLIDNNLTGSIIPEIGSLVKLEALGLTRNRVSGTIPSFIGNLSSLVQLSLASCNLQGLIPESLVQLQRLQLLNLVENHLTGEIPYALYNISSITIFSVRSNRLQGNIPSDVCFTLPNMRTLDLGDNHFTGVLPPSLSNSSSLERINLALNNFTGEIIKDFKRLSALRYLFVSSNHLEGDLSFISSMINCTSLKTLLLFDNLLTGSLPDSIRNLSSHLSYLSIAQNQLHGRIPPSIGDLLSLTRINFAYNDLEGPIPFSIGKLYKLQEIYLGANRLTDELPFSFGNLTLLNHLYLRQNNFLGNIPRSLSNCSNLLTLDLSLNNLDGPIPPEIVSLSSISITFNLAYNIFTGPIPLEVGSLRNLANLDLSHNRLSGFIPNSLSSCVRLERLHLDNNALNGEIPDGLTALRGLQVLDLSQNNLSGLIPRFLSELPLLKLNLSFNRLQGEVPTLGVFQNGSAISLVGNSGLCGGIVHLKLPPCSPEHSEKKHFPTAWKILIPLLGAGAICLILSACFIHGQRISQKIQFPVPAIGTEFLRLSYADLLKATGGFSEANLLGAGRFGSVYKGLLNDEQTPVAVKVLNLDMKGASNSFISECNALRGIRHRNLLKILSICPSTDFQGNDFKALVYEYMANGSLEKWLHQTSDEASRNLSTIQRLNIAIDIASALDYLHFGTDSTIVHGDLKPSNILLDESMTALLGDFGLARVVSSMFSRHESSSLAIKGTIGYIAPEYGTSNMVSTSGDVYSFGIFLLEMFTNRRPTDGELSSHSSLHDFVSRALPSQVTEVLDPFIVHEYKHSMDSIIKNCMVSVLGIGVACSKQLPGDRMSMMDVVNELHKIKNACMVQ